MSNFKCQVFSREDAAFHVYSVLIPILSGFSMGWDVCVIGMNTPLSKRHWRDAVTTCFASQTLWLHHSVSHNEEMHPTQRMV